MSTALPPWVVDAVRSGKLALFLGAGFGSLARLPSSPEIANLLARDLRESGVEETRVAEALGRGLQAVAGLHEMEIGATRCQHRVAEIITEAEKGADESLPKLVHKLGTVPVITTNYDSLLMRTATSQKKFRAIWKGAQLESTCVGINCYYAHGLATDPASIIITDKQYNQPHDDPLDEMLRTILRTHKVVCLGFSGRDEDFRKLLSRLSVEASGPQHHRGLLVVGAGHATQKQPYEAELEDYGYEMCPQDAGDVLRSLVKLTEEWLRESRREVDEEVVRDPLLRKLKEDPASFEDLSSLVDLSSPFGATASGSDPVAEVVRTLRSGSFGSQSSAEVAAQDLITLSIAHVSRESGARGQPRRFASTLKLHKICYFAREYLLSVPLQFEFQRYPYGVWSPALEKSIDAMVEGGLIARFTGRASEGEPHHERPGEFELTRAGEEEYSKAERRLQEGPGGLGPERVTQLKDFVWFLYGQKTVVLGLASKRDFIDRSWGKELRAAVMTRIDSALRDLAVKDPEKEKIKQRIAAALSPTTHAGAAIAWGDLGPDGVVRELARRSPRTVFDPRRIAWSEQNGVPTNYYVPLGAYREDSSVVRWVTSRVKELLPKDCAAIVVLADGIAFDAAKSVAVERHNVRVIGPVGGESVLSEHPELGALRGVRVAVMTNATQTGRSAGSVVQRLKEVGLNVGPVIAIADRGVGASEHLAAQGVRLEALLRKSDLIDIVRVAYVA
ncbi:MAG: SIR2 family protein [Thermoplasmata archaeon]